MANLPNTNQNPGDLKFAGQANATQGANGFAKFSTPQEGYGALLNQIQTYITKDPNDTVADFANKWAPPSDNNDTAKYAADLSNQLGVAPNTPISTLQPKIGQFADAIAKNEGYSDISNSDNTSSTTSDHNFWSSALNGALGLGASALSYAGSHLPSLGGLAAAGGTILAGGGPENPVSDIIAAGEAGAAIPGLFGKGTSSTPPNNNQNETPTTPTTENPLTGLLGNNMTESSANTKKLNDLQTQQLQTTQGGRIMAQDPHVQGGIQANSMFGFAPEIGENGSMDYTDAMQKSSNTVGSLNKQIQGILDTEDTEGDYNSMKTEAKNIIRERLPEFEWKEADKHIDDTIASYQQNAKQTDKLGQFNKIKHDTGSRAKFGITDTNAKKAAFKSMSVAARKEVEKNTKNPELYNATMKMEQNLINGQKVMKRLNGKKAIKNEGIIKSLLKGGGNLAGAYLGEKIGGPIGAVLGYLVENNVSKQVEKKLGNTLFQTPGMKKALKELQSKSPTTYKVLVAELEKKGISKKDFNDESKKDKSNPQQGKGTTVEGILK